MIYLASQSPRRSELLRQIGVAHELLLAHGTEDSEALELQLDGEAPEVYVQRVTRLKLEAALVRLHKRGLTATPILCADTTVSLAGAILAKPKDAADAHDMLARLSGKTHTVYTAIALGSPQQPKQAYALSRSQVSFDTLSLEQIHRYVASNEPFGKAGGYGIQGRAAAFINHIDGSYSGIMGLPLFETSVLLRAAGVLT